MLRAAEEEDKRRELREGEGLRWLISDWRSCELRRKRQKQGAERERNSANKKIKWNAISNQERISPANWREQGGGAAAARLTFSRSRFAGMTGGEVGGGGPALCNYASAEQGPTMGRTDCPATKRKPHVVAVPGAKKNLDSEGLKLKLSIFTQLVVRYEAQ